MRAWFVLALVFALGASSASAVKWAKRSSQRALVEKSFAPSRVEDVDEDALLEFRFSHGRRQHPAVSKEEGLKSPTKPTLSRFSRTKEIVEPELQEEEAQTEYFEWNPPKDGASVIVFHIIGNLRKFDLKTFRSRLATSCGEDEDTFTDFHFFQVPVLKKAAVGAVLSSLSHSVTRFRIKLVSYFSSSPKLHFPDPEASFKIKLSVLNRNVTAMIRHSMGSDYEWRDALLVGQKEIFHFAPVPEDASRLPERDAKIVSVERLYGAEIFESLERSGAGMATPLPLKTALALPLLVCSMLAFFSGVWSH